MKNAPRDSGPGSGLRLTLILLLWAAGLGAAGQFAKISVILPELAALYPGHGASIGFLVSLVSCLGVLLGLMTGVLLSRIGAKRLLMISLFLGALLSLFQVLLPDFPVFLLSRLLEGLSHLGIVVAAPTLIAVLAPERQRALAMSLWGTYFGVSFTVVAWAGIPLIKSSGVAALFLAHSAFLLVVLTALATLLPNDAITAAKSANQASKATGIKAIVNQHRAVYTSPFIAAPALAWFFYTLTFVALLSILPSLIPANERSLIASMMPLASIAVSMTLGVSLLKYFSAVRVVCLGFVLAINALALYFLWPEATWLLVLLTASLGLVQGASYAAIPQLNANLSDQALANGAMTQTGNLGNIIGTPLLLLILTVNGVNALLLFISILYASGLVIHALGARARKQTRSTANKAPAN